MASEESDNDERPETSHEPRECMACRGTGRVISNLGGTPSEVPCPWCEGTGMRVEGIDAQARWPASSEAAAGDAAASGGEGAGPGGAGGTGEEAATAGPRDPNASGEDAHPAPGSSQE